MLKNSVNDAQYQKRIKLRDGTDVTIRPLCAEDKNAFIEMFNRLSKETKFLRYHYVKLKITAEEAESYCQLDYKDKFVLIAEKEYNGRKEIVGIGRYDKINGTDIAEVSFLVDDKEQGKGICTYLLIELTKIAQKNGFKQLIGVLTHENVIMLDILRKFRPDLKQEIDGNDILVSFNI